MVNLASAYGPGGTGFNKAGLGTLNVTAPQTAVVIPINVLNGTMTISSRDQNGHVLSDDLNPATKCTKTLGP